MFFKRHKKTPAIDQRRLDSSNNEQVALIVKIKASTEAPLLLPTLVPRDLTAAILLAGKASPNLRRSSLGFWVSVLTLLALDLDGVGNRSEHCKPRQMDHEQYLMLKSMLLAELSL